MQQYVGSAVCERLDSVVVDPAKRGNANLRVVDCQLALAHHQQGEWPMPNVSPELWKQLSAFAAFGQVVSGHQ